MDKGNCGVGHGGGTAKAEVVIFFWLPWWTRFNAASFFNAGDQPGHYDGLAGAAGGARGERRRRGKHVRYNAARRERRPDGSAAHRVMMPTALMAVHR